jgi:hypothetical protein
MEPPRVAIGLLPAGRFTRARGPVGAPSLQLRVLGFGLLQDGDVGVGILPEV